MSNIKVTVQNENNVLLEVTPVPIQTIAISRGVAGRGVADVTAVEIDNALYLEFTFTDGTTELVGPVGTIQYIGQAPIVVTGSTISLSTVPVNLGGTGATTASGARTNLGLGTIATQNANAVSITGGTITGITDLAVADGGTGASTAAGAMVNLLPSYTGNANKRLSLDGTATGLEWVTDGGGTVTSVDVSGGTTGLSFTGGPITTSGTITLSGTLDVDNGGTGATTAAGARTNLNAADQALTLTAGTGLSGGGDLTANRSFSIANTTVTAGAYGAASKTLTATVNAQGQLTALADTPIAIANTQISGLGTMSTQDANSVAITGGSITGITDLAVADGGTGASDASGARTNLGAAASAITISAGTGLSGGGDLTANRTLFIANTAVTAGAYGSASDTLTATVNAQGQLTALAATPIAISNTQVSGLGTMSTQNSNSVTITGGSITGITDLAIADGGTGASNAADARSNLGLGTAAVLNAGVALGVATLDAGGTVPLSQIPASIQGGVSYQGAWNASTNTPTLTSSVGTKGHYYVVSVAGNTNLNGVTDWLVGDWAIYNGTAWEKIDNTDQVASVNGYTGVVVLTNTDVGAPSTSLTISAGTGLTGGGNLTTNRTISIANTAVTAASYGTASAVPTFTVNGQGQLTAAADVNIAITNTQVSGLGTMSTQNANSVTITGGSITGITDLAIADGGTGASNAADARTNLGVTATGGDTTYLFRANNLSDLASASTARTNLGLGTAATQDSTAFATAAQGAKADTAIQTVTSTDGSIVVTPTGTTIDLAVSAASPASTLLTQVRNTTGATLTKGTVVYISGATGQISTVSKAIATGDTTSAQTLGMITADLANNTNGYVTVFGLITNIDTSSYTDGAQLYLSGTTAGAVTTTKPSAPIHLVYVGIVEYAHPTQGKILVKVQNGYELDEIHDVSIVSPVTGQTLVYNSSTDLWVNNTVSLTAGVNGTLPIANGGTGQTTANAAFNALAPSQTGNSGKYLTTDGTDTSWASNPLGTVTSVAASVPSFLSIAGSPITTSGTLAISLSGTALPTTSGGTGLTSFTSGGVVYASSSSALATGSALTFDGTTLTSTQSVAFSSNAIFNQTASVGGVAAIKVQSNTASIDLMSGGVTYATNYMGADEAGLITQGADGMRFNIGGSYARWTFIGSEAMRLTSTGLGVGTSSPQSKLHISGANVSGYGQLRVNATDTAQMTLSVAETNYANMYADTTQLVFGTTAAIPILFRTNSTERMRLDSSGNLGLGVTPSSWTGVGVAFETLGGAIIGQGNNNISYFQNTYYASAAFRYKTTNPASFYEQSSGKHVWYNAPSGTAGNAITFTQAMTLDASGNLGVGTTSPQSLGAGYQTITVNGTTGSGFVMKSNNSNRGYLWTDGSSYQVFGIGAYPMVFSTNSTERMRLDSSGNLGIGTTSPATYLQVASKTAGDSPTIRISNDTTATGSATLSLYRNASDNASVIHNPAGLRKTLQFLATHPSSVGMLWSTSDGTTTTDRMTLDSSGNLGLAITPHAWGGGYKTIDNQIYNSMYSNNGGFAGMACNAYNDGTNWIYKITTTANRFESTLNSFRWFTAPSGTAGTAISFTQAMTLDASGRLGIGTTSPACKLNVDGTGELLRLSGTTPFMQWFGSSACYIGDASQLVSGTAGDFVIRVGNSNTNNLIFATGTTQRARIDTNGNLLVGATSVVGSSVSGLALRNGGTSGNLLSAVSSTSSVDHMIFYNPNGTCGTLYTTGTSFGLYNASDARLKQNISTADNASVLIDAIQVRKFDWKVNGEHQRYGFIAQELATVFPEAVKQPENPDEMMGVDYAKLVPMLVKAIQELKAEFDAYKASHP